MSAAVSTRRPRGGRASLVPLLAAGLAVAAALSAPAVVGAQETAARFEITEVTDSTLSFRVGRHRWVAPTLRGIAVDPIHRDALVARFRVISVSEGTATALVTGQTTQLTTEHVALVVRPRQRWWRAPLFWIGTGAGIATGLATGLLLGR